MFTDSAVATEQNPELDATVGILLAELEALLSLAIAALTDLPVSALKFKRQTQDELASTAAGIITVCCLCM